MIKHAKVDMDHINTLRKALFYLEKNNFIIIILILFIIKKQSNFVNAFLRYNKFQSRMTRKTTSLFDNGYPNITKATFSFHEFVSAWKNAVYSLYSLLGFIQA